MKGRVVKLVSDVRSDIVGAEKQPRARIVPIRLLETDKLAQDRFGYVYPDSPEGRTFVRVWLAHAANLSHDASKRMDNFLELRAPGMMAEECEAAKERAFRDQESWTAEQLGELLRLTMEERVRLRIGSIAPVDCDAEARRERAAHLHRERERLRRKAKREAPKRYRPRARSEKIQSVLPAVMQVPTSWICRKVAGFEEFAGLPKSSLRAIILREIKALERFGQVRTELKPRSGQMSVLMVQRVRENEGHVPRQSTGGAEAASANGAAVVRSKSQERDDYRRGYVTRLSGLVDPEAIPKWVSSEMSQMRELGFQEEEMFELQDLAVTRRSELSRLRPAIGDPTRVRR